MRAQVLTAWGGPEKFQLTDIVKPEIRPGTGSHRRRPAGLARTVEEVGAGGVKGQGGFIETQNGARVEKGPSDIHWELDVGTRSVDGGQAHRPGQIGNGLSRPR
jgi:hypothetical protein